MAQQAHEHHRGGHLAVVGAAVELFEQRIRNPRQRRGPHDPLGDEAAEGAAALEQILDLFAVLGGTIEGRLEQLAVADGNTEAIAKAAQLLFGKLLLLMGDVATLANLAEPPSLHGLGENHRR